MYYEITTEFGAWRLVELPLTVALPVAPTDSVTMNTGRRQRAPLPRRMLSGKPPFT